MDDNNKISGASTLAWTILTLLAFVLLLISSSARGFDVYDISAGLRAITQGVALLFGGYIAFAWSGAALIFMVVAFHSWLPAVSQSHLSRSAAAFGLIAGALFLYYGLIGGHGYLDLSRVKSVRSAEYIADAYLPLALITNRALATAVSVSGLWFVLINWHFLRASIFSRFVAYVGLVTGVIALSGFVMPAGDFGVLSLLLLGVPWGIIVGLQLLRRRSLVSSGRLP
jgi:hypothetical protein